MQNTIGYRQSLNIIILNTELDDLGLTANAFRVYCHLARLANTDNATLPSDYKIGAVCFGAVTNSKEHQGRLVLFAIQELLDRRLVLKVAQGGTGSYLYELTPTQEWVYTPGKAD
jgi:hypothetical protein